MQLPKYTLLAVFLAVVVTLVECTNDAEPLVAER